MHLFLCHESSMVSWLKVSIDLCLLNFMWHIQLYFASGYAILHCFKMLSINIKFSSKKTNFPITLLHMWNFFLQLLLLWWWKTGGELSLERILDVMLCWWEGPVLLVWSSCSVGCLLFWSEREKERALALLGWSAEGKDWDRDSCWKSFNIIPRVFWK